MFENVFTVTHQAIYGLLASGAPTGTAFAIGAQGYLATAAHVVQPVPTKPLVAAQTIGGYREFPVQVVSVDQQSDLAILRIDGAGGANGWLRISADPALYGNSALVLGYPVTYRNVQSGKPMLNLRLNGCVVASDLTLPTPSGTGLDVFELDCLLHPGMSGAPVLNLKGEVVGIVSHHFYGINKLQGPFAQAQYTAAIRGCYLLTMLNGLQEESPIS